MVSDFLNHYFDRSNHPHKLAIFASLSVFSVACLDFVLGPKYATSIFYFIPISLAVWYGDKRIATAIVVLASITWFASDFFHPDMQAPLTILTWNFFVRSVTFSTLAFLLLNFRRQYDDEKSASHTDSLTGALSVRACHETLALELYRSKRLQLPFALAYIDLDNFKFVNDQWGHAVGDDVLVSTVASLKHHIRRTDFIARLGGDEFLMYFNNMGSEDVRNVMEKLHGELKNVMIDNNWPITYSIGVVNFNNSPDTVNDLIKIADNVMYSVKKSSKASISYSHWPTDTAIGQQNPN